METITKTQLRKIAKIFRKTGKTFQYLATESGLSFVPDHANELSKNEARQLLKYFGEYLIEPKNKQ